MGFKLKISGIIDESIVDGPGLRFTVFTQGCPHRCQGCHNPQTHDFDGGSWMDTDEIMARFDEDPLLAGMTFSGGEPFCQPEPLWELARQVKARGKNIVIYSGYTFDQLKEMAVKDEWVEKLLRMCDLLVDGPYVEGLRDLDLLFRGSSNQRILDISNYPNVRDVSNEL
ncbi:anaerobic ribonucleoside-triphosphate reductase activating protein [Catenibacillus scindens]|uniref:Anaerobic ribonucleoside-triphosphate reductase-activating protein n=1 Tax=Catenibacillus scindens TaxID=673271 RepID=A0A7W8H7L9_9FIRM|nr:anaerobic ribonucleoside-triphosphate reductase activating protein [Catenibacillus scindens]MBB5263222.1 anaerobic ribonucleoside-triphosphate reductase activating protein [Catenibacillus scindens]